MATSARVEEVKPLTAKHWGIVILYLALLTAAMTTETLFLPAAWGTGGINVGPSGGLLLAIGLPWAFAMIMLFLMEKNIIKIDKQMFCLLFIATGITTWYSVFKGFYTTPAALFNIRVATAETHGYALPMIWMPSADAVRGMFYKNSLHNLFSVYASEWMPVIATYVYWYIVTAAFFLGWAAVFRRLWVEIEVLPFPHAQGWLIAEAAYQPGQTRFKKFLKISFLIGLLFYVPYMIYSAYPGLPDFYGWLTNPLFLSWSTGQYQLTNAYPAIAQNVAAPIILSTDPLRYAFFFLVPLDALFSMWVGGIIFTMLVPQVLSYFGYYTGIYAAGIWSKWWMIYYGEPFYWEVISAGMALGILVFMILVNWKYFAGTLKGLAGGGSAAPGEVSYRLAYLLIAVGAIGLIVLFIMSNVEPQDAVLGLLIIMMQVIVLTRARAYTANITFLRGAYFWKPFVGDTLPAAPQYPAGKLFIISHTCRWGTGCDTFGPYYSTMAGAMDSFKVAQIAGVKPDTVFKLLLIGSIISAIIVIPLTFIELHAWGFMELPVAKEWDYFWDGDAGFYNPRPSIASIYGLTGFLLTGALIFLRMRFPWWPLEPLGFMLGLHDFYPWHVGTFTPLIVWIAKYALLKVGGRKAYEEVGVPVAIGIIAGEMLGIVIVSLINIARFMVFGAY
ncbi:MAG: OPT/YSL family transporter [Thermofilaceae archaeon]|nr:OPT/YSL family transporter [Thermofilaceae archaeon]